MLTMKRIDPPDWASTKVELEEPGGQEARLAFAPFLEKIHEELRRRVTTLVNGRSSQSIDVAFSGTYYVESERYAAPNNCHELWIMLISQEQPDLQAVRIGLSEEFRKRYSPDGIAFESRVYLDGETVMIEEFTESWWGPTAPPDPKMQEVFAEHSRQSRILEALDAADAALRERRFQDVVSLLEPLEPGLKKTDLWKLNYAKKQVAGGERGGGA
jgi:hypothetical protein